MTESTTVAPTLGSSWIAATTRATRTRLLIVAVLGWVGFTTMAVWLWHSGGPTGLDHAVLGFMVAHRTPALSAVATALTALGSFRVVAVVGVLIAGTLVWRTRHLLLPLTLVITLVETASIVYLSKEVVGRDRPPLASLVGPPALDPSFPSGHSTSGTVVWVLGALLLASTLTRRRARRLVTATGILLAVVIGLTRVQLGYHWATDVLGGWLLATAITASALYLAVRLRPLTDRLSTGVDGRFSGRAVVPAPSRRIGRPTADGQHPSALAGSDVISPP